MRWFFGIDRIKMVGDRTSILNFLEYYDIEYDDLKIFEERIEFSLIRRNTRKLKKLNLVGRQGIEEIEIISRRGLFQSLIDLVRRPGLVLGAIIFMICVLFYGSFVFDIKINGNDRLSEKYVLDALESCNFKIGSYIPKVDFDRISNEICLEYGDISWMFINMMGNVAYVEMREYQGKEKKEEQFDEGSMTDLIATEEGQIYRYEVSSGIVKISIGETALKGDILVSGSEKGDKADYYGRSVGEVYAKTYHTISFKLPRVIEITEVSEKIELEKWIEILGFRINISKKGSNFDTSCDIIEESSKLTLPGGAELPVVLTKRYEVRKNTKTVTLTDRELKALADKRLSEEIEEGLGRIEILSMNRNDGITEDGYSVECSVYCIKNIAKEVRAERREEEHDTQ